MLFLQKKFFLTILLIIITTFILVNKSCAPPPSLYGKYSYVSQADVNLARQYQNQQLQQESIPQQKEIGSHSFVNGLPNDPLDFDNDFINGVETASSFVQEESFTKMPEDIFSKRTLQQNNEPNKMNLNSISNAVATFYAKNGNERKFPLMKNLKMQKIISDSRKNSVIKMQKYLDNVNNLVKADEQKQKKNFFEQKESELYASDQVNKKVQEKGTDQNNLQNKLQIFPSELNILNEDLSDENSDMAKLQRMFDELNENLKDHFNESDVEFNSNKNNKDIAIYNYDKVRNTTENNYKFKNFRLAKIYNFVRNDKNNITNSVINKFQLEKTAEESNDFLNDPKIQYQSEKSEKSYEDQGQIQPLQMYTPSSDDAQWLIPANRNAHLLSPMKIHGDPVYEIIKTLTECIQPLNSNQELLEEYALNNSATSYEHPECLNFVSVNRLIHCVKFDGPIYQQILHANFKVKTNITANPVRLCNFDSEDEICSFYSLQNESVKFLRAKFFGIVDAHFDIHKRIYEFAALTHRLPYTRMPTGGFLAAVFQIQKNETPSHRQAILCIDIVRQNGNGRLTFDYWTTMENYTLKVCTRLPFERLCTLHIEHNFKNPHVDVEVVNPITLTSHERFILEIILTDLTEFIDFGNGESAVLNTFILDNLSYEADYFSTPDIELKLNKKFIKSQPINSSKLQKYIGMQKPTQIIEKMIRLKQKKNFVQNNKGDQALYSPQRFFDNYNFRKIGNNSSIINNTDISNKIQLSLNKNLTKNINDRRKKNKVERECSPLQYFPAINDVISKGLKIKTKKGTNIVFPCIIPEIVEDIRNSELLNNKEIKENEEKIKSKKNKIQIGINIFSDKEKNKKKDFRKTPAFFVYFPGIGRSNFRTLNDSELNDIGIETIEVKPDKLKGIKFEENPNEFKKKIDEKKNDSKNQRNEQKILANEKNDNYTLSANLSTTIQTNEKRRAPKLDVRKFRACTLVNCDFHDNTICHYTQWTNLNSAPNQYHLGNWRVMPIKYNTANSIKSKGLALVGKIRNYENNFVENSEDDETLKKQFLRRIRKKNSLNSVDLNNSRINSDVLLHKNDSALPKEYKSGLDSLSINNKNYYGLQYVLESSKFLLENDSELNFKVYRKQQYENDISLQVCLNVMSNCGYEFSTLRKNVDGFLNQRIVLPKETKKIFFIALSRKPFAWLALTNIRLSNSNCI